MKRFLFSISVSIILLCVFVAGPLSGQEVATAEKTVPVFEDGQAQIVDGFKDSKKWIRHDLWVETEFDSDGDGSNDRVHVDVTRPEQTETEGLKLPIVYNTSPYFKGTGSTSEEFMWNPKQELGTPAPERTNPPPVPHSGMEDRKSRIESGKSAISNAHVGAWVPRGYIVVHSCSPGTGLSQGCPSCGGDNESLAPKSVIDWLCGRAKGFTTIDGNEEVKAYWSTGKVGMTGTSYNGTLPFAAATTGVEGLEAIIPIAPNLSYYHYYRANGLVRHPGGYMGEDIDVLYDFIHSGNPEMRDQCNSQMRDKEMGDSQDRKTGDYNEFWAGRDYMNDIGPLHAATLFAHGLNDWNVMPSHSIRFYHALKKKGVPCQLYLHQGGHGGPPPMTQMNRWFTRYLHGIENDVEKDPRSWVVRESDSRRKPTAYADYPHPDAESVSLFLTKGGSKHGGLVTSKPESQGQEKLTDDVGISGSALAKAAESNNRLIYASPILTEPLHLSGTSTIKIRLASDKPAANLSVWMVSLPWEVPTPEDTDPRAARFAAQLKINSNLITRGWADPQNSESLEKSAPLVAGQFYELEFELEPDDQIIPAGQQIGLMIFSSDRDFTLWPQPGTELTVDLEATSLSIPVVGGTKAWTKATGGE